MTLQNCRECGRLFVGAGPSRCPECIGAEEAAYRAVVAHLEANHDSPDRLSLEECSRATGVSKEVVLKFTREGRLSALTPPRPWDRPADREADREAEAGAAGAGEREGRFTGPVCRICQRSIQQGRYCVQCADRLTRQLRQVGEGLGRQQADGATRRADGGEAGAGTNRTPPQETGGEKDRATHMIAPERHGRVRIGEGTN